MKTKLILIGLLLTAGLFTLSHSAPAQRQETKENVVLRSIILDVDQYFGIYVYVSSSSSGAPKFPHYWEGGRVPIAQALTDLRNQGYKLINTSSDGTIYNFEK